MNTYLTPLVADLCTLWDGVDLDTCDKGSRKFIVSCSVCLRVVKLAAFLAIQPVRDVPDDSVNLYLANKTILGLIEPAGNFVLISSIEIMYEPSMLVLPRLHDSQCNLAPHFNAAMSWSLWSGSCIPL